MRHFVTEMGTGVDLHGQDGTKAALRAVRNAFQHVSLPGIRQVAYSNFCDIGWKVDEAGSRGVLVVVLDNLVKGAAGSAVQNLNIMLGIDERTGLL